MKRLRRQFVAALVGLYPARWKREYGKEFADVLTRRPLGVAVALNVIWNALGQRFRCGEPWFIVGAPCLALNLTFIVWNILYPWPYITDSFSSPHRFATLIGVLLHFGVGYWTVLRDPASGNGGRAAMKNTLLIAWPLSAIGLLYGLGILKIIVLGPGDAPTTFLQHGFAYTFYDHVRRPPPGPVCSWCRFLRLCSLVSSAGLAASRPEDRPASADASPDRCRVGPQHPGNGLICFADLPG